MQTVAEDCNIRVLVMFYPNNFLSPQHHANYYLVLFPVADPGGREGHAPPPGPVKISHKKDGRQRQPHRFHVSRPPPHFTRLLETLLISLNVCTFYAIEQHLLLSREKDSMAKGTYSL